MVFCEGKYECVKNYEGSYTVATCYDGVIHHDVSRDVAWDSVINLLDSDGSFYDELDRETAMEKYDYDEDFFRFCDRKLELRTEDILNCVDKEFEEKLHNNKRG